MDRSPWLRRWGSESAGCRLICFPHAGGAASSFAPLARAVAGGLEVVALQYPGRQERLGETCVDNIEGLTAAIVPELNGELDGPFALFGHSMGAIVGFEVARALEHGRGRAARGLFVSGRRAPTTWRDEQVHRGGDSSLLREVARLGGTPSLLLDDEDVQQMMLPALRGDYKAIETYRWQPGPPLSCPVWALVGEADPLTTVAEAAAWAPHTTATFELRTYPGTHFYLADHLDTIADLLTHTLLDP